MTKYSFEDKHNAVVRYLNDLETIESISKDTGIGKTTIWKWIQIYKSNKLIGLGVKHSKNNYDIEFKIRVVDYYLNISTNLMDTALHFDIDQSQVFQWSKLFRKNGVVGLQSFPKGRPPKMNQKNNNKSKTNKSRLPKTEKEQYEEEILNLKKKLHHYEMEHDILKAYTQIKKY